MSEKGPDEHGTGAQPNAPEIHPCGAGGTWISPKGTGIEDIRCTWGHFEPKLDNPKEMVFIQCTHDAVISGLIFSRAGHYTSYTACVDHKLGDLMYSKEVSA
jgi:hypothetical protein